MAQPTIQNEHKTFIDVFQDVWKAKYFLLSGLLVGLLVAASFLFFATPHKKAYMIIAPAHPMNGVETSSLLSDDNLFALRHIMQRVGVGQSSDFLRFKNIYDGVSVSEQLLKDPKITAGLQKDQAFSVLAPQTNIQSPEYLADYIARRVILAPVDGSHLRRMSYLHPDQAFAKYFLSRVHATTDALIRRSLFDEATKRVSYLEDQLTEIQNPEHRRALTSLLMEQERMKMLVAIDMPYAAAIIEPPAYEPKTAWPQPALVIIGLGFIGLLCGFLIHQLRAAIQGAGQYLPSRAWKDWAKPTGRNNNEKPLTGKAQKPSKRA